MNYQTIYPQADSAENGSFFGFVSGHTGIVRFSIQQVVDAFSVSAGAVTSVNGRVGAVTPQAGDYSANMITGLAAVASSGSAADLGAGILPDARLSSNVPRKDAANVYTAAQTFNNSVTVNGALLCVVPDGQSGGYKDGSAAENGQAFWAIARRGTLGNWVYLTNDGVFHYPSAVQFEFVYGLTMTGAVTVPTPTAGGHAATKGYVDATVAAANPARTYYASRLPGMTADCDVLTGAKVGGGTATTSDPDFANGLNAMLATATADDPVEVVVDGGFLLSGAVRYPATGNVTLRGFGLGTGFFLKTGANTNGIQPAGTVAEPDRYANTDLGRYHLFQDPWQPGYVGGQEGKNVVVRDLTVNANGRHATYGTTGNVDGTRDGTITDPTVLADTPDPRGPYPAHCWLVPIFLAKLDGVLLDNVWTLNSPTSHVRADETTNLRINRCRLWSDDRDINTDVVHLDGGCWDVWVTETWIKGFDDGVACNFGEGSGNPGGRVTVDGCHFECNGWLRVYTGYGPNAGTCTAEKVAVRNCRGITFRCPFGLGIGSAGAADAIKSVTISDCQIEFEETTDFGVARWDEPPDFNAVVDVFQNAGLVEVKNLKILGPTRSVPVFRVRQGGTLSAGMVRDCTVFRRTDGNFALPALELGNGDCGKLTISGYRATAADGLTITDAPAAVYGVSGAGTLGELVLEDCDFDGFTRVLDGGTYGTWTKITARGVKHTCRAGGAAESFKFGAGSTAFRCDDFTPVGVTDSKLYSGNAVVSGNALLASGQSVADAVVADGTLYLNEDDHADKVCFKLAGGVYLIDKALYTPPPPATPYAVAIPYEGNTPSPNASPKYLSIPSNSTLQPDAAGFATGCAVNFTAPGTSYFHAILAKWNGSTSASSYLLYYANGDQQIQAAVADGTTATSVAWGTTPSAATWYFPILVWVPTGGGAGTLKLYVNGTMVASAATTGTPASGTDDFGIGGGVTGQANWRMDGAVDNAFFVAGVAWTDADATWAYNSGSGRTAAEFATRFGANLKGMWDFQDNANLGLDATANNNDLTNNNGSTQAAGVVA